MKTVIPDYYREFNCLAAACRHNCCREGWEIDIDDRSCGKYRKAGGVFLELVHFPTVQERRNGDTAHFIINEQGVCPFQEENGLCRMILDYGKQALCDICRDHPRFRNYYRNRLELGLGLCCEAAAMLVLGGTEPVRYEDLKTGEAQQPEYARYIRPEEIGLMTGGEEFWDGLTELLLGQQQQLEGDWTVLLRSMRETLADTPEAAVSALLAADAGWEGRFGRLREYLLFRHYRKRGRAFTAVMWNLLLRLCETVFLRDGELNPASAAEAVRVWSSEIEYSEENMLEICSYCERMTDA